MGYMVDLNSDLGESFGAYRIGMDEEVIPCITSANLACGFHASDPVVMERSVRLCRENAAAVGAHPGFPDLQGFGRRNMNIPPDEIKAMVQYQIGALSAFCKAEGIKMQHVKPHGALYNMAARDKDIAEAICRAAAAVDPALYVMAQAGSRMEAAARNIGLKFIREVFADRAYEEDGTLVARGKQGAMITDEELAIKRVITMIKEGKVTTITGREIGIRADSVCVHGDGEKALLFVQRLKHAFEEEGIQTNNFMAKI